MRYIFKVDPVIDRRITNLCKRPYYNHPKGCPNYNKKDGCPPNSQLYNEVYDLSKPVYAIINRFDLASHVGRMRTLHPEWSDRQLYCVLYWQGTARKQLQVHIDKFLANVHSGFGKIGIETCPEAMGVNVIKTMRQVGVQLKFPVTDMCIHVALAGVKRFKPYFMY